MGLRDITGVFSRYFIVGFFLPVFFTLLLLTISVHEDALPHQYKDLQPQNRLFAIGGAALFVGLLLLGLRQPIWKLFEGATEERARVRRMTALGQLTKAYREAGRRRWGLDVPNAWPLISSLLTSGEHDLDVDLETDARLFLNACIGALGIAVYWLVELIWRGRYWEALVAVVPLVPAYLLYLAGVVAARRWYEQKLAAAALHRFELYERVGLSAKPDERPAAAEASELAVVPPPVLLSGPLGKALRAVLRIAARTARPRGGRRRTPEP
jgi:hypothetical protein